MNKDTLKRMMEREHGFKIDAQHYIQLYDKCNEWYRPKGEEYDMCFDLHEAGCLGMKRMPKISNGISRGFNTEFIKTI